MARAFSRSVCNSWPVQNNDSKTWTGKLLNTLQLSHGATRKSIARSSSSSRGGGGGGGGGAVLAPRRCCFEQLTNLGAWPYISSLAPAAATATVVFSMHIELIEIRQPLSSAGLTLLLQTRTWLTRYQHNRLWSTYESSSCWRVERLTSCEDWRGCSVLSDDEDAFSL